MIKQKRQNFFKTSSLLRGKKKDSAISEIVNQNVLFKFDGEGMVLRVDRSFVMDFSGSQGFSTRQSSAHPVILHVAGD